MLQQRHSLNSPQATSSSIREQISKDCLFSAALSSQSRRHSLFDRLFLEDFADVNAGVNIVDSGDSN
jgi:hypothetical protein